MKRFFAVFSLLAALVPSLHADIQSWNSQWVAFRAAYPYHTQVIALSNPGADGQRLLIISEPPPNFRADDLSKVNEGDFGEIAFPTHRIGYDGWVRDVAIELKPMSDAKLTALVDRLHIQIFGTAYKAMAVSIPASPKALDRTYNFDLHVSAGTLKHWLLPDLSQRVSRWAILFAAVLLCLYGLRAFSGTRKKRHVLALLLCAFFSYRAYIVFSNYATEATNAVFFRSPFSAQTATANELMSKAAQGIFYSEKPGLVLWIIAKDQPLTSTGTEARRFAVDSDIILGSVGSQSSIAIVARERVAPIDVLPPLRTETVMLLASVKDSELAQSYERNHILAGKFDGHHDWAPIYLSDELLDTEYGSLLNITDQLLKSWSMSGKVRYINFGYPDPERFPFPKPLNLYANTRKVTFNWNTKGAGYSSTFGDFDVFAWTRTGALPVDYLGNQDTGLHSAEDTGYEYFATRSDPNLVRVVQYAELYQIFRHFAVGASVSGTSQHLQTPPFVYGQVRSLLNRFLQIPDASIQNDIGGEEAADMLKCKHGVTEIQNSGWDGAMDKLVNALAAPRAYRKNLFASGNKDEKSPDWRIAEFAGNCQATFNHLNQLAPMPLGQIMAEYAMASYRPAIGWIHTPSIVVSQPFGEVARMTGGHNLDSAATLLRPSTELHTGQVKVVEENGQRFLEYSPDDTDRIQQAVRPVAREDDTSAANLESKAMQSLQAAKADERPLSDVLNFTARQTPSADRGFAPEMAPGFAEKAGWWIGGTEPSDSQRDLIAALNSTTHHTIVIERDAISGYNLFDGPNHKILHASTKPGSVDAVFALLNDGGVNSRNVHLHFRGFEAREARGFAETARLQAEGAPENTTITATLDNPEFKTAELKAFLSEQYNFKEVEIRSISDPIALDEGRTAVDVEASLKSAVAGKPSLLVRIRIILKAGIQMTSELMASIRQSIASAFSSHILLTGVTDSESLRSTSVFVHSLKKINPHIEYVEVKVEKEGKDLQIVFSRHSNNDGDFAG